MVAASHAPCLGDLGLRLAHLKSEVERAVQDLKDVQACQYEGEYWREGPNSSMALALRDARAERDRAEEALKGAQSAARDLFMALPRIGLQLAFGPSTSGGSQPAEARIVSLSGSASASGLKADDIVMSIHERKVGGVADLLEVQDTQTHARTHARIVHVCAQVQESATVGDSVRVKYRRGFAVRSAMLVIGHAHRHACQACA